MALCQHLVLNQIALPEVRASGYCHSCFISLQYDVWEMRGFNDDFILDASFPGFKRG